MSYRDDAIAARADFAEDGGSVVVAWEVTADFVPGQPDPAPQVFGYTAPGIVAEYNFKQTGTQADSLIQAGDRNLFLAACDEHGKPLAAPPFGATVTLADGSAYSVHNCKALQPDGMTAILFDITIRR